MKQLLLHIRVLLVLMIVVAFSYNTEAVWAQTVPTSTENAQDSTRPTEDSASNDEDSNTGTPDNDADNNPEPTISPVPTNSPEPTPDIPSPSPDPLPEPSPDVTPEPTVTPTPTESPEPTPDPSVTPQPSPEPTISPAPSPEPTVTPTPTGSPEPTPDPSVTPQPSPEPNDDDNQQPEEESPEQSSAPIDQSGEDPPIDGTGGSPSDQNSGGAVDETSTAAEPSGISLPDLSSISDLLDPQNLSNLNPFRSQSSEEENDGKPARPKQLSLPSALSLQPELAEAYEVPDWADQPPAVFVLGSICCFSAGGWLLKSQNLISLLSGLRL